MQQDFQLILNLPSAIVSALLIALVFAQSPQIVKSFKNLAIGAESAVSVSALSVSSVSILLWFIYAVLADVPLILLSTTIAVSINISIIVLELIGKRRRGKPTYSGL